VVAFRISIWSHFTGRHTVTKNGGSEALEFKKWGLEPNSLMKVYAYASHRCTRPQ